MISFWNSRKIKKQELKAFADGEIISIEEVEDPVFSTKMLGDGIAIIPNNGILTAPADGNIILIMDKTYHALGMRLNNGMEILLHIGIDTVKMCGKGFKPLVSSGDVVHTGDKLIQFDPKEIELCGFSKIIIMVITNSNDFPGISFINNGQAKSNETIVCRY